MKNKKHKQQHGNARRIDSTKSNRAVKAISKDQVTQNKAKQNLLTIPFDSEDRLLIIGEGDFSFAKSLVETYSCFNVTATCYDSKTELHQKYSPQVSDHIEYLEDAGQTILYSVDATKLDKDKALTRLEGGNQFDHIIFNFPHVGGKTKDVNRQVRFNQELLVKFFGATVALLAPFGTVIVTLFEGEPYTLWNIRDLARHAGLQVIKSFRFISSAYPGYRHARTLGNLDGEGAWRGEDREARSYIFGRKQDASGTNTGKKRKRQRGDDSDDEV